MAIKKRETKIQGEKNLSIVFRYQTGALINFMLKQLPFLFSV